MFREDLSYTYAKTLTGRKLLVGVRDDNSSILIKKEYEGAFFKLKDTPFPREGTPLREEEKELLGAFKKKGYLKGSPKTKGNFNEYNSMVKVFKRFRLRNIPALQIGSKIFWNLFFLAFLPALIAVFLSIYKDFNYRLDITNLTLRDIIIGGTLIPFLTYSTHELGHYIMAQLSGVKASYLTFGFFITAPVIYVEYLGLNLYQTHQKVAVISGGVLAHMGNVLAGVLLTRTLGSSHLLSIWILANLSMVIASLLVIGPTDGYFIFSSLLGIFNLRYRGYEYIAALLKKGRKQQQKPFAGLSAVTLLSLWALSFGAILKTFLYYASLFGIDPGKAFSLSLLVIILCLIRFVLRVVSISNSINGSVGQGGR